ncbi:DEAD/DEAH box helicase [Agrilactobacillus fermenti]|uniref:DEAD/DEAH box helicase n=1 Tax=Agrilactobacillus fermenti TaxID=2586909 RepID=UPI003A5BD6EA
MEELLYGRRLTRNELVQLGILSVQSRNIQRQKAITYAHDQWICQRCHSNIAAEDQLADGNFYCRACIQLGRLTTQDDLYHLPEPNLFRPNRQPLTWQGQLTTTQYSVARTLQRSLEQHRTHLLWAVTGAGKTEMLFPVLAQAIQANLRIALASPRVDVCNELYPRIQQAFQTTTIQLQHGRSTTPYQYTQMTICTTHQLLRYYHAFDLLIIDEVDAFPFVNDRMLNFAVENAVKRQRALIYLTATPTAHLLKMRDQKKLCVSYLPQRFHGRPLPVPKLIFHQHLTQKIKRAQLPNKLLTQLKASRRQHRQILIFLARIEQLADFARTLNQKISGQIETVHAADKQRLVKVQQFREKQTDVLVTTTILERGVTFSNIDVYVINAEDQIFTTASLVQIAGRAGRDANFANGRVIFLLEYYTRRVKACLKQIKYMNQKAGTSL